MSPLSKHRLGNKFNKYISRPIVFPVFSPVTVVLDTGGCVVTVVWDVVISGVCRVRVRVESGTLTPGDIDTWSAAGTVMVQVEKGT